MKTYDSNRVSVSIAGIPIDAEAGSGGYADGDFLTIVKEGDDFMDVVGVDGEVTRSKNNDRRATVTVRLMQSSDSNAYLSALATLDRNAHNGAGIGGFQVKDIDGTSLYTASECWISKTPDVKFGKTAQERVWTFRVANLFEFTGGN